MYMIFNINFCSFLINLHFLILKMTDSIAESNPMTNIEKIVEEINIKANAESVSSVSY